MIFIAPSLFGMLSLTLSCYMTIDMGTEELRMEGGREGGRGREGERGESMHCPAIVHV